MTKVPIEKKSCKIQRPQQSLLPYGRLGDSLAFYILDTLLYVCWIFAYLQAFLGLGDANDVTGCADGEVGEKEEGGITTQGL